MQKQDKVTYNKYIKKWLAKTLYLKQQKTKSTQIQGLLKYLEEQNLLQLYSPEIRRNLQDWSVLKTQNK